jgi:hypothetical protein
VNAGACGEPASAPAARYAYIREIGYLSTVPVHKNKDFDIWSKIKSVSSDVSQSMQERRRLVMVFFSFVSTSLTRFPSSFSNSLDAQLIEATSPWILHQQGRFAEAYCKRRF